MVETVKGISLFSRFASRRSLLLVALGSVGTSYGIGLPVPRMGALNEDSHLSSGLPKLSTHGGHFTTPSPLLLLGHDFLGSQNSEYNRLAASRVRWETIRILIIYRSINIAVSAVAVPACATFGGFP